MPKPPRNLGASIRARLLNLAKQRNQPFDLLLTRYVDFLGFGSPDPNDILNAFREICAVAADDAVSVDLESIAVDRIRDELEYGGLRVKANATVDGARVRVVIDIGFGDAIEPGLEETELPVLLDLPAPRLRAYARETVIAEKFQAMVMLGRANSRMKDLYDIWLLSRAYEFKGDRLARAIDATFKRRKTDIPRERPDALPRTLPSIRQTGQMGSLCQGCCREPGPACGSR
jgi:hypothetical protein